MWLAVLRLAHIATRDRGRVVTVIRCVLCRLSCIDTAPRVAVAAYRAHLDQCNHLGRQADVFSIIAHRELSNR